jgi:DNA polymerase I-like protein with 3'-5' exonuclease and polymerase domains
MFNPPIIAFDYESNGLDYWSPTFKVFSCAFAYRYASTGELKTRVVFGEENIKEALESIARLEVPLICHNVGFEYGVTKFKFPGHENRIQIDTMRLAQVYDNGGTEDEDRGRFGLEKCVERILPDEGNHKEPAYRYIREHFNAKPGQERNYISQLPEDVLAQYNAADAIVTFKLYEKITSEFERIGYNWQLDHMLYINIAKHISMAKARGIAVDFGKLMAYQSEVEQEVQEIDRQFHEHFSQFITEIEEEKKQKWITGPKTERGQERRRLEVESKPEVWKFKPKSKLDLEKLLVEKQGVTPTFRTPKGSPSFAAAHIHTYGEGGTLLANRNKRLLVHKQVSNLLALSSHDLRWHSDLKATGTKTGRMAGGNVE